MDKLPKFVVEEIKIASKINESGYKECTKNPLPDVPVHFIQAGGFKLYESERPTIYDREKMFRINSTIKRDRWLKILYPLSYGRFFYSTKTRHYVQKDDPELVISSIELALNDYKELINKESKQ
jgi:hypothetical protein